jgi:TetR/AcrR family transcriptional repressor of mexJK operon
MQARQQIVDQPPAPSRRDARRHDRRQKILAAAAESFLRRGYAGTTMSGIAATMGGSKGTLWRYFPSKEHLFAAFLDQATAAYRARLSVTLDLQSDLPSAIESGCLSLVEGITSDQAIPLYRLVIGEAGRLPEIGRLYHRRLLSVTHSLLGSFIAQAMDRGLLLRDDPDRAARSLMMLCMAGCHQQLLTGHITAVTRADVAMDAERARTFFLRAYAPSGSDPSVACWDDDLPAIG